MDRGLNVWVDGEWIGVARVAQKIKHRVPRLKALGNACLPQLAQMLGLAIQEAEDAGS